MNRLKIKLNLDVDNGSCLLYENQIDQNMTSTFVVHIINIKSRPLKNVSTIKNVLNLKKRRYI